MNKKRLKITLTSLISCLFLGLSACGGDAPAPHTHTFSTEWTSDESYHWHKCTGCDAINDKAEHTFVTSTVNPDYEHQGYTHHECSICHYFYNDNYVDPLEHHYESTWSKDESCHWHKCTDEGYETLTKDYDYHDYGEWIIDRPASKTEEGSKHHVCETCQYVEYKVIPAIKEANRIYTASDAESMVVNNICVISKPIVFPAHAYENVKYISADENIATVNSEGIVSAKAVGNVIITIYNDNNNNNVLDSAEPKTYMACSISARKDITVTPSITEASVKLGENLSFSVNATGSDVPEGQKYYSYLSTNKDVADVKSGRIYGLSVGEADIYVGYSNHQTLTPVHVTVTHNGSTDPNGNVSFDEETINTSVNKVESVAVRMSAYDWEHTVIVDSSNSDVATAEIDKNTHSVKVTTKKTGSTIISITNSSSRVGRLLVNVRTPVEYNPQDYYDNYYGNLTWENSEDLISKLHTIISNNQKLAYDSNWEQNQSADENEYYRDLVNTIYSTHDFGKKQTNTQGWQREHGFAASLMTGFNSSDAINEKGRATDFHNLISAYYSGNTARGNKNFGYANPFGTGYVSELKNPYGDYVYEEGKDGKFEPNNVDKGQLARAIFYMAVRYNAPEEAHVKFTASTTYNVVYQALTVSEANIPYSSSRLVESDFAEDAAAPKGVLGAKYRELAQNDNSSATSAELKKLAFEKYITTASPFAIGNLNDLLKWNAYSVSLQEYKHNQNVYSVETSFGKQGNRNPFVDYPELVEYAFGSLKDESGSLAELTPSVVSLGLTENVDAADHLYVNNSMAICYEVGDTLTLSSLVEKADMHVANKKFATTSDSPTTFASLLDEEGHVFTKQDTESTYNVAVSTIIGKALQLGLTVTDPEELSFDTCKFSYKPSTGNKSSDYSGSGQNWTATFSGVQFDVYFGKNTSRFINRNVDGSPGVTIGSENSKAGSVTFTSKSSYNNVNGVFFYALTNSGLTFPYSIYVDNFDTPVFTGTVSGNTPTYYGGTFNKVSGKIRLELGELGTELLEVVAVSFCGIAFNYED